MLVEQTQNLEGCIGQLTEDKEKLSTEIQDLKKELDESVKNLLENQEMMEAWIAAGSPIASV